MITNVNLTTKEQYLLQDQKTHEEQCILKYDNYANLAADSQLKSVFRNNGQKEREHLQIINELINGKVPNISGMSTQMNQSGQGSQGSQGGQASQGGQSMASAKMGGQTNQGGMMGGQAGQSMSMQQTDISSQQSSVEQSSTMGFKASDKDMCIDMLETEKYVSSTYNTAIFEFGNADIRNILNHIQTEEQKHGEAIFSYMQSKGMYSAS